jgi:hypothetical protein
MLPLIAAIAALGSLSMKQLRGDSPKLPPHNRRAIAAHT